jgi:hypothetical protein
VAGANVPSLLGLVMSAIFAASWGDQCATRHEPVDCVDYLSEPDFWNRTPQNWQSELLAVGSMAIFAVYLRRRGSPVSKQVGALHQETASTSCPVACWIGRGPGRSRSAPRYEWGQV